MCESITLKKEFLSRKLERESANLEKGRLQKLEEMILPVYEETKSYQTRQENIEKTLTAIDTAINYYNVGKEVGYLIKHEKPSSKLEGYLDAMGKIKKAIKYFTDNHPGSPELVEVTDLYGVGQENLEREFEALLSSCSKPIKASVLLDVIGDIDEDSILPAPDAETQLKVATGLTEDLVVNLKDICKWLFDNMATGEFMEIYSKKRSHLLVESLQKLKDHRKSGSGTSILSMHSVSLGQGHQKTPRRASAAPKMGKQKWKTLMKGDTSAAAGKMEEEVFEFDVDGYISVISALLKLIEFESSTVKLIVFEKHQRQVFDMLLQQALNFVVADGELLSNLAQKAACKFNFKVVVGVFPVVRHLRATKPKFEVLLESCQTPTRSKLPSLVAKLNAAGSDVLNLFIDSIKNDPERLSNMPIDGTVHELTRNTMHLMSNLKDFAEVVGAMLMIGDLSYGGYDVQKNVLKVADYLTKILSALGMNLGLKADSYTDEYKGAIFMLNNYNYIFQTLQSEGHFLLIHKYDPGVEKYYLEQLEQHRVKYCDSFRRLISFVSDPRRGGTPQKAVEGSTKLTDKEKQNVKDKFTGFNKELEDLCRTQKEYAVPDGQLRERLKKTNRDLVVPYYTLFFDKYSKVQFTKSVDKYIKYTAADVSRMLNGLFDTTS